MTNILGLMSLIHLVDVIFDEHDVCVCDDGDDGDDDGDDDNDDYGVQCTPSHGQQYIT